MLLALISLTLAPQARAQSFGATNYWNNGVAILYAGTNTITTNGFGAGYPINVDNYDRVGIHVSGTNAGTAAGNITIALMRSTAAGYPTSTDWETNASTQWTLSVPLPTTGNTQVHWYTNLPDTFVYPARWIAIAYITNNPANALTNCYIEMTKKIIPIRYP